MVINIGMVIHDKINLQNAVDLAAIYAAQRQAETLDAMAHINYQIRQSYKLLAWRYLILGNLGAHWRDRTRYKYTSISNFTPPDGSIICPNYGVGCNARNDPNQPDPRVCEQSELQGVGRGKCPYAVCVFHPQFWSGLSDTTHLCQQATEDAPGFEIPTPLPGDTLGLLGANIFIERARETIFDNCNNTGFGNWLVASSMYLSFFFDQFKRRQFIENILFNNIIKVGNDITGQSIEAGVRETIKKNLTYINHEAFKDSSLTFETSAQSKNFNDFFSWETIWFDINYIQNTQSGRVNPQDPEACKRTLLSIFNCPDTPPGVIPGAFQKILEKPQRCKHIIDSKNDPPALGFYKKNPKDEFTVKVAVTLNYRGQIFFPFFRNMTLTAKATAKPFGARFGPPQGADSLLPDSGLQKIIPNYSRLPGDTLGLFDAKEHLFWNKVLVRNPTIRAQQQASGEGRKLNNYQDLISHYASNTPATNDPMVVDLTVVGTDATSNYETIFNTLMRVYEDIAISPDKFDLAYYTILPNYMTSLYQKLKYDNQVIKQNQYVPADLGHLPIPANGTWVTDFGENKMPPCYNDENNGNKRRRDDGTVFWMNYIEKQILCANHSVVSDVSGYETWKFHRAGSINDLLTSWSDPSLYGSDSNDMYSGNSSQFQKCEPGNDDSVVPIGFVDDLKLNPNSKPLLPSHCLTNGGRTGFSVKLIASD